MENTEEIFIAISLEPKTVKNILKNAKVTARLKEIIDVGEITTADKTVGNLRYLMSTKMPEEIHHHTKFVVDYIKDGRIFTSDRLTAGFKSLAKMGDEIDTEKFESDCGVGVVVTQEEIDEVVGKLFEDNNAEIMDQKWHFKFATFIHKAKEALKWADGKMITDTINRKTVETIGEKPKDFKKKGKKGKGKKDKPAEESKDEVEDILTEYKRKKISDLIGRDMNSMHNSEEIMAKHNEVTGGKVMTRFPPEPNGYLHIGHAKAMRFNFMMAADNDGHCYLRYDDTNPEKESKEYIDSIADMVKWLGYTPYKTTFSSDYFQELYEYAVDLIKRGKAYVCHQTPEEMSEGRKNKTESPYRNRSIEENLELFENMRQGKYEEGECCLRMKIQMDHDNPNMRDHVAYRIKYTGHPHAGDGWCIYPTYDYTHCICDSIEDITHSLCTLEFENRRESYYWLLEALDIYRPYVWEYSRLNVSNTILSKRKIDELIKKGYVESWSDPRLMTLDGLKKRGVTAEAINEFCDCIGVARKGNEKVIDIRLFEHFVRKDLDENAPRTHCVLEPLKVVIENVKEGEEIVTEADQFPGKP